MKTLLYLFILSFLLVGCAKDCEYCQMSYQTINGYSSSLLNQIAQSEGYVDYTDKLKQEYPGEEECGDALDDIKEIQTYVDLDFNNINDVRLYYDCN